MRPALAIRPLLDSPPAIRTEVSMRLIGLAVVLALSLTLPTLAAKAQETAKKAHVGVLLLTPRAGAGGTYIEALRGGLRELGYVEGQNLLLEIRSAEGRPDRL